MLSMKIGRWLGVGAAVATIAGSVSALFGTGVGQPLSVSPQATGQGQNIVVSTINQSGGTTAGQIIGGHQPVTVNNEALAAALEKLAADIEAHPVIIGQQIRVSAGPGSSGDIIGQRIEVSAGPGSRGTIIGSQISVSAGQRPTADMQVVSDLRQVAPEVRGGTAPRSRLRAILETAGSLANAGITAVSRGSVQGLLDQYGG